MQTLLLVSHTHWDREWYLTFEQYRVHLVDVLEQILDTLENVPDFHSFTFDGQTSPIIDYLEICPEAETRIRAQVEAGRLIIGPNYVIPDGFAPSGEASVRNLLIGRADAERLGGAPDYIYIAEPTNFPEQLPQILNGFGYDAAVFGRGHHVDEGENTPASARHTEFVWAGPMDSHVLVHHTPRSYTDETGQWCSLHYCNAVEVFWCAKFDSLLEEPRTVFPGNVQDALTRIGILREHLAPAATGDTLLFMQGCDHLPAQPETSELIREVNEYLDDAKMVHGSFGDFLNRLRTWQDELTVHRGESRAHGGAMSHVFIQRLNRDALNALERWMEPAVALSRMGKPDNSAGLRRHAWRLALQNLCHDTIWGASVDAVYDEFAVRQARCMQIADDLTRRGLEELARGIDTESLPHDAKSRACVVFSTSGWEQNALLEAEFHLPTGSTGKHLHVVDASGTRWPAQILERHEAKRRTDRFGLTAKVEPVHAVRALVRTPVLPSVGGVPVAVSTTDTPVETDLSSGETWLENDLVRVDVHPDGSFDLTDKRSGRRYPGLNRLVDQGDVGHGWAYKKLENDTLYSPPAGRVENTESGPVRATIRVQSSWKLPVGLTADGTRRRKATRTCPLTVEISLTAGSPRVNIHVVNMNRVLYHRIQAHFSTTIYSGTVHADAAFGIHERPVRPESGLRERDMMYTFVDVSDGNDGVAILTQGVPQYEARKNTDGAVSLALTLMRGVVGHTEKHDPDLTHGAQCLGEQVSEYAFLPHRGDWLEGNVHREAQTCTVPPRMVHTTWHGGCESFTWLSGLSDNIGLTGMKPAEDGTNFIVRFVNLIAAPTQVALQLTNSVPIRGVWKTDLREQPAEQVTVSEHGTCTIPFGPKEIVTLLICPGNRTDPSDI